MGKQRGSSTTSSGGTDGRGRYQQIDMTKFDSTPPMGHANRFQPQPQGHLMNIASSLALSSSNLGGSVSSVEGSFPPSSHPTSPLLGSHMSPLRQRNSHRYKICFICAIKTSQLKDAKL